MDWVNQYDPDALILDLRPARHFLHGFIPDSIHIPGAESLALLAGHAVLECAKAFVVTDLPAEARRVSQTLRRLGMPRMVAHVTSADLVTWETRFGKLGSIEEIGSDTVAIRLAGWKTVVVDIRDSSLFREAHIPDSIHIELDELAYSLWGLPEQTRITIVCKDGAVSPLAASLLCRAGFQNLAVLSGGFAAYRLHGLPVAVA